MLHLNASSIRQTCHAPHLLHYLVYTWHDFQGTVHYSSLKLHDIQSELICFKVNVTVNLNFKITSDDSCATHNSFLYTEALERSFKLDVLGYLI